MSDEAHWYKDAIFYELRIRSFYDGDDDGTGDFRGLTEKLDYLQDLGVNTLWVLPFYPSPLRDDGYDIADYTSVDPDCGTLRDFRLFLRAAHRRGLRVVTELVLNHTSDQHPWFQRARRSPPGSRWREFYVWSDTPKRYTDARIIFKDFEHSNWAWDPVASAYYWHRFYSHQPDLNYANGEVREAMFDAVDFWFDMGVDGLRLDAVPYLFEREGTSCENLEETHAFLRELRAHVDGRFDNRMLLAEANQWPEDAVAYLGRGDECHMAFHFPVMPRLFMAIQMEDRYSILDILDQTPSIDETCQWALFLRNHDELTLEMVTDEERDYMIRAYADDPQARVNLGIRRRLAPLLGNDRRKIELMNALLFSLPGTPILYYGDELGMGDNVYLGDRNGVRTPMQWSPDRNAGFSKANPQRLVLPLVLDPEFHCEAINVETAQANPNSLLWWTKRIIALRKQHRAFGRGVLEPLTPSNRKVLAFLRRFEDDELLVVANLSRFAQYVELDLSEFEGRRPLELFGSTQFPAIGELPYLLTLGPHAFYWFSLRRSPADEQAALGRERPLPMIDVQRSWDRVLESPARMRLEAALPDYLQHRRWFRSKARRIKSARLADAVEFEREPSALWLLIVDVEFYEGEPESYALAVRFQPDAQSTEGAIAQLRVRGRDATVEGALVDASESDEFARELLTMVARRRRVRGRRIEIQGFPNRKLRQLTGGVALAELSPHRLKGEQTNTSWNVGDRLIAKMYRRVEDGPNPELEVGRYLAERSSFGHVAPFAGHIEIRRDRDEPGTLVIVQGLVANEGDAWRFTLDELERYLEGVLASGTAATDLPQAPASVLERARTDPPAEIGQRAGGYLEMARLLGRRTGELHVALAAGEGDPAFTPEPFTPFARRSFYQSLRNQAARTFELLLAQTPGLADPARVMAQDILGRRDEVMGQFAALLEDRRMESPRIRCHSDYHLGQVLYTGGDFVVIDFEGEPARPLGERRLKRSPLADVAGMVRSFRYAVESVLVGNVQGSMLRPEDLLALKPWTELWYAWVSALFLRGYLDVVVPAEVLPDEAEEIETLLDIHLLEKNLYEVGYELNNRPDWVVIPLRGITDVLASVQAVK